MHHDPLKVVYAALERHDCNPTGPEHDARAICPAHDGGNAQSLKLSEGADGRALLCCYAHGCDVRSIVRALGLQMWDLFPDWHHKAPKHRPVDVDALGAAVRMLRAGGIFSRHLVGDDRFWVSDRCPSCGVDGLWLHRLSSREVQMACWSGCSQNEIRDATKALASA